VRQLLRLPGLSLLFWSLCVAVAALSAVAFFADRVQQALLQQGASALAADMLVEYGQPIDPAWLQQARQQGLQTSLMISFPSVVFAQGKPNLVQVKAVDGHYPLRGELKVQQANKLVSQPPRQGYTVVAQGLVDSLQLVLGQSHIPIGKLKLQVAGVLQQEPDPGANVFRLAPRVLMHYQDALDSGLLGPASRARYRLLVAGDARAVDGFRSWLTERLPQGAQLLGVKSGRPELVNAVERAERFLDLAALCASLLAGIGILLAARHFVQHLLDQAAILRAIGMQGRQIIWRYTQPMLWVGLFGGLAGVLLGFILQWLAIKGSDFLKFLWLDNSEGYFKNSDPLIGVIQELPAASWQPVPVALLHAFILLLGFALPALWALQKVSPLRVLRRDLPTRNLPQWLAWALAVVAFYVLLYWQVDDAKLASSMILGLLFALCVFALLAYLLLAVLKVFRRQQKQSFFALAGLTRDPALTLLQLSGYGLAITLLLLLSVVRNDILQAWEDSLPAEAPNYFLLNIQPQEVASIRELLEQQGIKDSGFYPMTRGRLTAINGKPIDVNNYAPGRAQRLATREYSLGFSDQLQSDNRILQGVWWQTGDKAVSIEQDVAELLSVQVGDTLQFSIAGQNMQVKVASVRSVSWDSFNVNFFIQGSAVLIKEIPHAVITSVYLPEGKQAVLKDLTEQFPAVSAINLKPILQRVRSVIEQGALAVQGVFLFTLLAAMLVSLAAIQISRDQRTKEIALLRVLGASRQQVWCVVLAEFALLGLLAGLMAAALANVLGVVLADTLFSLSVAWNFQLWLIGGVGGLLFIGLLGYFACRPLLRTRPVVLLRTG
jgi:putative ABC transport system permease protein